jgi:hypothetical protein
MKKILYIIIISIILYLINSCSATKLIERAVKKDPTILKDRIDSVTVKTKEIKGEAKGLDTVFVDDQYITIIAYNINDSIKVNYEIKQQLIDTILKSKLITVIDTVVIHKTRQEIRLDARQKRLETKIEGKNEKVFIRQSGRISRASVRKEAKGNQLKTDSLFSRVLKKIKYFFFALILILVGFVLGVILKTFRIV